MTDLVGPLCASYTEVEAGSRQAYRDPIREPIYAMPTMDLKDYGAAFISLRERLYSYLFVLVRDRQLAEDLLQELYLVMARAVERGEAIHDLDAWCRGTARNLALHHWREQRARPRTLDAGLLELIDLAFTEDPEALRRLAGLKELLARCCASLSAPARRLLDLKYRADLAAEEIAATTGRSRRGVITALARIREQLEACVRARLPEGDA